MIDLNTHSAIMRLLCAAATVWETSLNDLFARNGGISTREREARQAIYLLLQRNTHMTHGEIAGLLERDRSFVSNELSRGRRRLRKSARFRLLVETAQHYWLTGTKPQPHPAAMLTDEAWAAMEPAPLKEAKKI